MRTWYYGIDDSPFIPPFTTQRQVEIDVDGNTVVLGDVDCTPRPKGPPWFYSPETKNHPWLDLFQSYSDEEPPFDVRWSKAQNLWVIRSEVELTLRYPIDYYVVRDYFKVGY